MSYPMNFQSKDEEQEENGFEWRLKIPPSFFFPDLNSLFQTQNRVGGGKKDGGVGK